MKKNSLVFVWSLIVALGGFLFGYDTAVISGVEQSIQKLFNLDSFWHGFAIASALIGTVIGALSAGKPADKYGRKFVLFIVAFLYAISAVGSAMANNLTLFIIFRILGGIAVGASSVVAPMYISEISPAKVRGRMTALFQFNVIFGILMAYVVNYLLRDAGSEPWRWMLGVMAIPSVFFFFLLFIVPPSPRFLVKIGEREKARKVLMRIETGDVVAELREIELSLENHGNKKDILFSKLYSKPIFIAVFVGVFNQLSGINAVLYYAPRMFELAGVSSSNAILQPIYIGIANAIFTMLGLVLIDRVGRKKLLVVGSIGMALVMALVSRTFYLQDFGGYTLLIYLIFYIMFFAFSTGAVVWVLIAEVFPNAVRGQGQSLGSCSVWFSAGLITFLFPIVAERTENGGGHAFAFFTLMMIIQAFVVWKYFPETKGKTLEQLGEELSK
jgi:sugar porter (SP) family MFS transporter